MYSINEVTIDHINHLSAEQLSELLHNLLRIEAEKNSLDGWSILVPQKITVADGGEDGRIEWTGNPKETKWLKNKLSIFQNKAANLTPANCFEEILETAITGQPRKLKSQVEDVVIHNGCYILFTSQDLNTAQVADRIAEFRRAIQTANHTNHGTFQILVYDANKIKDWVNENVAAVTFVQACNGITRPHNFRTWDEWKKDMIGSAIPFQTNDILLNNIKQIRAELKREKVVRVIGHSGLGKTRMILETFRENVSEPEIKAQQSQLVYYDMGMGNLESITGYILSHRNHQSGILVIDNCDENSHNTVSGLVRSSGNFKLITIDFSSDTNERSVIKIDRKNQRDIVQKIVDEKFGDTLTKTDKEFLSNQSEGYPQMAILFSDSVSAEGFDKLNSQLPDDFLKKLIFGRNSESEFEYEVIKACSVLSSFGFVDDNLVSVLKPEEREFLNKQTDYVRNKICGSIGGKEVAAKDFYKVCLKYKKTNIIEQRGTRIMVKPTPLAINLAAQWWKETPHDYIKGILSELTNDELGKRLVERLAELDQLDKAKEIVNQLWGPNSPFGTAEVLNSSLGSLLFRYVVEVNPIATVKALEFSFGKMSKEEILKIDEGRRNLVWALEKLCFRKETFNTASKILYSFAVSENETWGNNSTNQFRQLFQLYLSGTEASLVERLEVIKWGLEKHDDDYTQIAILAMGRGLMNDHFTRMGGAEKQGSSAPLEDYRPTWKEISEYWIQLLDLLTQLACSDNGHSNLAKEKIAHSIRTLIRDGNYKLIANSIRQVVKHKGNLWTEALNNLKMTLGFEKHLPKEIVDEINSLIIELTPTDIKNQLLLKVTKPEWDSYEKDAEDHYIDKPKLNVEAFAKKIVAENIPWLEHLQDLLEGEQRQGFNFGTKIGELSADKENLIDTAIQKLKQVKKENQNPEFIAGLLFGAADRELFEKTIDRFIADDDLRKHAFYLTRVINATLKDIEKLFSLIDKFGYSIHQFKNFQYGRALDKLSNEEVIKLCDRISKYGNAGKWTALSLLYMFCYSSEEKWQANKGVFKSLIASGNMTIDNENTGSMDSYHWSDAVIKLLTKDDDSEFAITITKQIIEFCSQAHFNYSFDTYIGNVILHLFDKYFETTWKYFGEGIIGDYMTFFHLEHMIGTRNGYLDGREGIAFRNPERHKIILEWCRQHPEIAPERITHMMPLSINEDNEIRWHPFSKAIIDEFGDNEKVLRQLSSNMGTFGTVGSRIPYFTTQKKLLEVLVNHKIPRVKEWAIGMLEYTEKTIKREQLDDEEHFLT